MTFVLYCCVDHADVHAFPTRRSSDLAGRGAERPRGLRAGRARRLAPGRAPDRDVEPTAILRSAWGEPSDRKSTRLNSSHTVISYAVYCLKKKHLMNCNWILSFHIQEE